MATLVLFVGSKPHAARREGAFLSGLTTILRYLKPADWALAALGIALILVQVFFDLRLPDYMTAITVIIETEGSQVGDVLVPGLSMLGCALGSLVAAVCTGFCIARVSATLSMRLREAVFSKTLSFSMAETSKFSISSLITRCTNDVTQVQMLTTMGITVIVKAPVTAAWAIGKIAGKNVPWTIAVLVCVVILLVLVGTLVAIVLPKMTRMQTLVDGMNRVTREHLTGLRVIRAFGSQGFHSARFDAANDELTEVNLSVYRAFVMLMPFISFLMSAVSLVIYTMGAVMIQAADAAEKLTLFSQMVVFSSYAMQVIGSFMMLAMIFVMLPRAMVSVRRISEVLRSQTSISDGKRTEGEPGMEGTVEFRNVGFGYPGSDGEVVSDVSFVAEPGQTVALIGSTGSGKTTLLNLAMRFYDTTSGSVLVDGVDVRDYTQASLHDRMAYVPQKSTLFSGTVAENIAYGEKDGVKVAPEDPAQLDALVRRAARVASADGFVEEREDGYGSHVSQGGANFSGGQKQRLSIARAVARKPEIYLFDDSFSALDYKTDSEVRQALREQADGATVIIVAQRISTIRNADRIVVLDDGRVAGQGTHDELMAGCETYRQIARSQLSDEELGVSACPR